MHNQVKSSVARLLDRRGSVSGFGYLVSDDRIITCAHMIALALELAPGSEPEQHSIIAVDFPLLERGKQRQARLIAWRALDPNLSLPIDDLRDVAVLELIPDEAEGAPLGQVLTDGDYQDIVKMILEGSLIPFLGAGVNLCDREEGQTWRPESQFLPSGEELSRALASEFEYPSSDYNDLLRVSQYVALMHSLKRLYESLRKIFDRDYAPTSLHHFLARLPGLLKERNCPSSLVIITTNYDDLLEKAFAAAQQPYEMVSYWRDDSQRGKLLHWPLGGQSPLVITGPNYDRIELDGTSLVNPLILKLHGAVDRRQGFSPSDTYVITEDHYLDYLTHSNILSLVPKTLKAQLVRSGFLFLGYSLRDWNLRVFLNQIHIKQKQKFGQRLSWAIQKHPGPIEQGFWAAREVQIFDANLRDVAEELERRI